ncbi:CBS domain-containing protein [Borborobacter arsenicus]|uniref:CBS domain-containing protein n=1 Tax=Borborobacter arsenicus TaxID=1851146 RepID=UPI001404FE86|nr:CBS domain-containing protein [Pseudaminobacter arsenicus]
MAEADEPKVSDLIVTEFRSLRTSDLPAALLEALSGTSQDVFPVLDENDRVAGTIGELDLLRVLSPSEPTLSFGPGKLIREGLIDDLEDMMMRRPSTCRVDEPLRAALKRMATMQIAQLVVVDKDDRLLGLLRGRDIFRALFGKDPA